MIKDIGEAIWIRLLAHPDHHYVLHNVQNPFIVIDLAKVTKGTSFLHSSYILLIFYWWV